MLQHVGRGACCGAKAMQDVPHSVGVGRVERTGDNPFTGVSERMSISPVHMHGKYGSRRGSRNTYGGLLSFEFKMPSPKGGIHEPELE